MPMAKTGMPMLKSRSLLFIFTSETVNVDDEILGLFVPARVAGGKGDNLSRFNQAIPGFKKNDHHIAIFIDDR
jgi:hypothetical protein